MNLRAVGVGLGVMVLITAAWVAKDFYDAAIQPRGFYIDPHDARNVQLGRTLYALHCASCHGTNLEGQPDWKTRKPDGRLPAPPHDETGHTWHHPDAELFDVTRHGLVPGRSAPPGYQSDMPAFGGVLTDPEIVAILAYIKSTWPADMAALQEKVTRNSWHGGAR